MQALTLPARRGWRWFFDGFAIFRKSRLMLALLLLAYWMLMALLNAIPVLGQIVATIGIPALSVSLMNAMRQVDQGVPLTPQVLFSGFNENWRALLVLGVVYLFLAIAILGLSALIDGGALLQLFLGGTPPDEAHGDSVQFAATLALAAYFPVLMGYWYAPMLAAWHGLSAGKALFFSLVACLRNWRAFLVYFFAAFLFGAVLPGFLLGSLSGLFSQALFFPALLTGIMVMIVAPTLYASFYVSYRDVFVSVDDDA